MITISSLYVLYIRQCHCVVPIVIINMIHHTIIAAGGSSIGDRAAAVVVVAVAGVATALVINNYKTHARALALCLVK